MTGQWTARSRKVSKVKGKTKKGEGNEEGKDARKCKRSCEMIVKITGIVEEKKEE